MVRSEALRRALCVTFPVVRLVEGSTSSWLLAKPFSDGSSSTWDGYWSRIRLPRSPWDRWSLWRLTLRACGRSTLAASLRLWTAPARFGFMYATTALHVEEGQERFVIDFDPESGSVSYLIEAVSRPRHILARIGYPFSRAMQHRFARDSHARMRHCILDS